MEYIPAVSLLLAFVIIFIVLTRKFTGEQMVIVFTEKNFLLLSAVILFCVMTVVHLFQKQEWTADILKVIVGVLVGASAAYVSGKKPSSEDTGAIQIGSSQFGNHVKIAGRDINEIIEAMYNEVSEIRDSIINQYNKVTNILEQFGEPEGQVVEYLFYTAFLTEGEPINEAAKVIRDLQSSGWHLFATTSSYIDQEGIVLIFRRTREPRPDDEMIPGTGKYRVRVYHGRNAVELDYQ